MLGTILNVATVSIGSIIGLSAGNKLPKSLTDGVFKAMGLFTLVMGFHMSLDSSNLILLVLALISGTVIGELLKLQSLLEGLSDWLKNKLGRTDNQFTEAILTSFMLFCIGSLTILGAIEDGLGKHPKILITKSIMDAFSSIILSSRLGIGVLFSVIPLLLYQGSLTLGASALAPYLSDALSNEIGAVGGVLIIGLGLNILDITKLKLMNFLPALLTVVPLFYILNN